MPTRVPDDLTVQLFPRLAPGPRKAGSVPVIGMIGSDDPHPWKRQELDKLATAALLLDGVESTAGAGFVYGVIRGRLGVLRDFGVVSTAEYRERVNGINNLFNERWPGLLDELPE